MIQSGIVVKEKESQVISSSSESTSTDGSTSSLANALSSATISSKGVDLNVLKTVQVNPEYEVATNWTEMHESFESMGLNEDSIKSIHIYGIENPSIVQKFAIEPQLKGYDVLIQSPAGTGKSTAFIISIIQNIKINILKVQVVIISPTRELAQALKCVIDGLSPKSKQLLIHVCLPNETGNERPFSSHIIIGAPSRVSKLFLENKNKLDTIQTLVVDEADDVVARDIGKDLQRIFSLVSEWKHQTVVLSTILEKEVNEFVETFMNNPIIIQMRYNSLTLEGSRSYYVAVDKIEWKYDTLEDLFLVLNLGQCLIYCNTRREVEFLYDKLVQSGTASKLHMDMDFKEREESIRKYRTGESRILISTDLVAREINTHLSHCFISYDFPRTDQIFLNRIGRSGKFGRRSIHILFILPEEFSYLRECEMRLNIKIEELPQNIADLY